MDSNLELKLFFQHDLPLVTWLEPWEINFSSIVGPGYMYFLLFNFGL